MRIAVAATPTVALPTLDWLQNSPHTLVRIITKPDHPAGRGRGLVESSTSSWARAHNIDCAKPARPEDVAAYVSDVDLVVTIGYGFILPSAVLSIPKYGFINVHFSMLPKWRGAAPVQRAILAGEEDLGVSVFALDIGMDSGPLYVQQAIHIHEDESAGDALEKLALLGPDLVAQTITMIESGKPPTPQVDTRVSFAPKIAKQEAMIDWLQQAVQLHRQIRAFTPEPGAWTHWRGASMRIDRAHVSHEGEVIPPGVVILREGSVQVGCGEETALVLDEVTPAGKRRMSAKSWYNGARVAMGERFV